MVGEETAHIFDDDRRLADFPIVIHRRRQSEIACARVRDDFEERHLIDGREEMHADELIGARRIFRQSANRKRRGVGPEDNIFANHGFRFFDDIGFDIRTFKDSLNDEVDIFEHLVIICRCDEF